MADLTRIDASQAVEITDGISQSVKITTTTPDSSDIALVVRNIPSGTQEVGGTITTVPTGTQEVIGTVTASGTLTVSGTVAISGSITTNADANVAPGTAPSKVLVGGLVYNSSAPTATNGQSVAMQADASGNLKVNVASGTITSTGTITSVPSGTQTVTGTITAVPTGTQTISGTISTNADANVAPGTAPSKVLVGGLIYNSSAPTATNGQSVAMQSDVSGNLKVNIADAITQTVTGTVTSGGTMVASGTVTTIPSGTQTITGTLTVNSNETAVIMNAGSSLTPQFITIAVASSGNNTLISAVSGKKLRIVAFAAYAASAVNIYFTSAAAGTVIFGGSTNKIALGANSSLILPFNPVGWFETSTNEALIVNLSSGVSFSGGITYVEI